jgi:hypothetical protein
MKTPKKLTKEDKIPIKYSGIVFNKLSADVFINND